MKTLTKTHQSFLLKIWALALLGISTGLATLSGCAISTDRHVNTQVAPVRPHENQSHSASVLLNHKQSALYQQMLMQGNYSDAAIFESFQHIQPLQSSPSSMFTNISAPPTDNLPIHPFQKTGSHTSARGSGPQLSANWHTTVGWKLVLDGNYRGAESAYRQALRQNANSAEAYLGLGMALSLQGNRQKAISAYEEAIKIQPDYAAALVHLGYAYTEGVTEGGPNLTKARTLFQQASKLGDPFALLALLDLQARKESA
ncbi:tetratricopeptide repeat protein [Candidatus Nitronereus thalassa]|uniref:Tetratricopeptide repeat protein n=1 Tax=Candidatus Nitronereus thalassa TaxID=3020898 RepID=A0ABU3KAI1_9BACT|nr:tetratricopeptide repeat protein [Candidatus Nitronereus thalassa]MDT7043284.1 tetratricopeptide repeat protein [Candidatus Nitronereus thalassa]